MEVDLHQVEYILAIEKEKSISKAAQKLFITQSALNQQLLKLEKEIGTALFERRSHMMLPTFAGSVYLENARRLVDIRDSTYKLLHDITEEKTGEISIAFTPERGSEMFSKIYPAFHALYPQITFRIKEARNKGMEQALARKEVTLACTSYTDSSLNPDFTYVAGVREEMVLGLPREHPLAPLAGEESWRTLPELELSCLSDTPFVTSGPETLSHDMENAAFAYAGMQPHVLFCTGSSRTKLNMISENLCAAFFPQSYIDKRAPMVYFSVKPHPCWTTAVAYRKRTYLTIPENVLIDMIRSYNLRAAYPARNTENVPPIETERQHL